ncbi:hypothetical protein CAOG_05854 [Capsaspora owczarzaki ATCC 30864]|nr:hypothetical protein CAOG_05854 [Capsaspora owczarzaki ATCC 30864]|eukprot:XP_004345444.2 hypothetical protein CAOG_05854 [Capsaspora owczarzaki ATCC 30864]
MFRKLFHSAKLISAHSARFCAVLCTLLLAAGPLSAVGAQSAPSIDGSQIVCTPARGFNSTATVSISWANAVIGVDFATATFGLSFSVGSDTSTLINVAIDPFPRNSNVTVGHLVPFTAYSFTLSVSIPSADPADPPSSSEVTWSTTTLSDAPIWPSGAANLTLDTSSLTDSSMDLSWPAPASASGPTPLAYWLTYATNDPNPVGQGPFQLLFDQSTQKASITGLAPGARYRFNLTCSNADASASASSRLTVAVRTLPGPIIWGATPPVYTTVVANSTVLVVSWKAPQYVQDASATYAVVVTRVDDPAAGPYNVAVNSTLRTATISGLAPFTLYRINVSASNSFSPDWYTAPATYLTSTKPGVPAFAPSTVLDATTVSDLSVQLDWAPGLAVVNDDPSQVRFQLVRMPEATVVLKFDQSTPQMTSFVDSTVEAGRNYTYVLTAQNSAKLDTPTPFPTLTSQVVAIKHAVTTPESNSESKTLLIALLVTGGVIIMGAIIGLVVFLRSRSRNNHSHKRRDMRRQMIQVVRDENGVTINASPLPVQRSTSTGVPIGTIQVSESTPSSTTILPMKRVTRSDSFSGRQTPRDFDEHGYVRPIMPPTRRPSSPLPPLPRGATLSTLLESSESVGPAHFPSTEALNLSSLQSPSKLQAQASASSDSRGSVLQSLGGLPAAMANRLRVQRSMSLKTSSEFSPSSHALLGSLDAAQKSADDLSAPESSPPRQRRTSFPVVSTTAGDLLRGNSAMTDDLAILPAAKLAGEYISFSNSPSARERTASPRPASTSARSLRETHRHSLAGEHVYSSPQEYSEPQNALRKFSQDSSLVHAHNHLFGSSGNGKSVASPLLTLSRRHGRVDRSQVLFTGVLGEGFSSHVLLGVAPAFWLSMRSRNGTVRHSSSLHSRASVSKALSSRHSTLSPQTATDLTTSQSADSASGEAVDVPPGFLPAAEKIRVAVKVLKSTVDGDNVHCQHLANEARLLQRLNHKNIIRVITYFGEAKPAMLVLEYLPYFDLASLLHRGRTATPEPIVPTTKESLHVLSQIASALVFLSEHHIVHRDVAARNCLVGTALNVKLSDFGLATTLPVDTELMEVPNDASVPIRWTPPETLLYSQIAVTSDVWQFGVLCHELFSGGQVPYSNVATEDIVPLLESGERLAKSSRCPDPLYELMLSMWEWDPLTRASMHEVAGELDALLALPSLEHESIRDIGAMLVRRPSNAAIEQTLDAAVSDSNLTNLSPSVSITIDDDSACSAPALDPYKTFYSDS